MTYSVKEANAKHDFTKSIKGKKVPILVLDQKWHHIFVGTGKPAVIQEAEKKVDELLVQQGHYQQELKDLKKIKADRMNHIMENMEGTEMNAGHAQSKVLKDDRRLIDEINERLEICEDALLDIPNLLRDANEELMLYTMEFCYEQLRENSANIESISEWIKDIRIELKKQIIRKQNAELKNKEIYSYMHDIFGAEMIDVFDLEYQEDAEEIAKEEKTE